VKFLVHCEQPNCYMHMTVNTEEEQAHYLANHKCPYWGGESKVSWSVTKTLVEEMWDMLDETMVHLMEDRDATDSWKREEKARARAFAECLAIFMRPFFDNADDIAREAARRYRAKKEGDIEYETAGLGNRRYESAATAAAEHLSATPGWYGTSNGGYTDDPTKAGAPAPRRAGRAATGRVAAPVTISDKDVKAMKGAYEGMPQIFTPAVLAKQYKYPESAVREALGLDTP
jgi:hypothetical protein